MTIVTDESTNAEEITLHVSGRFDFSVHQDFVRAYKSYPQGEKQFIVDLADAEYMDSSAMGMLLQLREYSKKEKGGVVLTNGSEAIKEILKVANFDRLFTLS